MIGMWVLFLFSSCNKHVLTFYSATGGTLGAGTTKVKYYVAMFSAIKELSGWLRSLSGTRAQGDTCSGTHRIPLEPN